MKQATTVEEQILLLRKRGLIIANEVKAKEILLDVGYYRLGFYWFPFEKTYPEKGRKRSHVFVPGISFQDVVDLYYFDNDLRKILLTYLWRIEVNLRTHIIYHISNQYKNNPIWFADPSIMADRFVSHFQKVYQDNIKNNRVIARHHTKYPQDLYAPAWKTLEYATFGDIILLFNNLKINDLKFYISNQYGIKNLDVFSSYIGTIRILRNLCAHGHPIYDLQLQKSIKTGVIQSMKGLEHHNLSGAIQVMAFLLNTISSNRVVDLQNDVSCLIAKHESKKIFPIISYLK